MSIIVEGSNAETNNKNTGASEQFLEGPTIKHALAMPDQEFATLAAFKTLATWRTEIADKQIFPSYEIEELAVADTEDTFFEGNKKYKTANGEKIRTFNLMVSLQSHNVIKSFNGKKMRVYEFTDNQELKGVTPDGTKVRGQLATIEVGKRIDALNDKPAYTPVTITYADYNEFEDNGVIAKPSWSHIEINGIFDVKLELVSASATSIKFRAATYIGNTKVTSLTDADITYKTSLGVDITHAFVAPATGSDVYELTGTSFPSGSKVDLDGVITQTEVSYESVEPLTVTIS